MRVEGMALSMGWGFWLWRWMFQVLCQRVGWMRGMGGLRLAWLRDVWGGDGDVREGVVRDRGRKR